MEICGETRAALPCYTCICFNCKKSRFRMKSCKDCLSCNYSNNDCAKTLCSNPYKELENKDSVVTEAYSGISYSNTTTSNNQPKYTYGGSNNK